MNLVKGNLSLSNVINSENIEINSGSVHHSQILLERLDFPFKENAFIPKKDWTPLSIEDSKKLFFNNSDPKQTVFIGKIDDKIIEIIKKINIHYLTNRQEVINNLKANEILLAKFNSYLDKFMKNLNVGNSDFEFHRLSIIPSGRYVTSINLNNNEFEYLGLHIDHSTIFNISTAHLSRNRVCINIGNEDRYLYILNLSLSEIRKMLSEKIDIELLTVDNITDYFFTYFADYPVLKIKQKPFEFYIAPTDNYIHDGSTYSNNYLDITLTYLGNFSIEND